MKDGQLTKKPTLAVDVDEVLAQFLPECNEWHNRLYNTSFKLKDYKSYNFCETWMCSDDEAMSRVYAFFASDGFNDLEVVPGAIEAMIWLSQHFELVVVTSRQLLIKDSTLRWLDKNFPKGTFKDVMFGNLWLPTHEIKANSHLRRTKRSMCEEIGAVGLIDDQPKYIKETKDIMTLPILFNFGGWYRWSSLDDHDAIAYNWHDAVHLISNKFNLHHHHKPTIPKAPGDVEEDHLRGRIMRATVISRSS